ncbi:MAG: hypothetical protein PHP57_10550 [Sideroxydans sp.]|nr:hypothetical protein [Sideroxydans sp.]
MLIRFAVLIAALLIVGFYAGYLYTQDVRYLKLALNIGRFIFFALLVFGALYVLENFGLVAWRVFI